MRSPDGSGSEGEARALALLHRAAGPDGFVAAVGGHPHYDRIWARDGAIAAIAAVAARDAGLIAAAARTLDTLARAAGPHGEIPSNVAADDVSFGSIVGRVDAPMWYAIAVGAVAGALGDRVFARRHGQVVDRALRLVEAWELNGRGLLPVPLAGTWADEYVGSGYLLEVQLLRLAALRMAPLPDGSPGPDDRRARTADAIERRITLDYWSDPARRTDPSHYHPAAYRRIAARARPFWLAGFDAAGYATRFDALANVLAVALRVGPPERAATVRRFVSGLTNGGLLPAFDPIIEQDDPDWRLLRDNHRFAFRNRPGAYHNGGRWPWITGFWVAAIAGQDRPAAIRHADAIDLANSLGGRGGPGRWSFSEYHDARTGLPGGVSGVTWSAAGAVIARRALAGGTILPSVAT